jgi:hypothetical protein
MTTPLAAKIARDYGTPAAVIDMDRVERNIARIQAACDDAGVANRPHIKTHKSPMLAKLQIGAGARGITCQKLGEAEVMADAGIDDILISYNLIGDEKMARLGALQARAHMTVAADNPVVIGGCRKRQPPPGARSRSSSSATPGANAPASRRRPKPSRSRARSQRRRDCSSQASCCIRPRPAGPKRSFFTMRRWPVCARTGLMPPWSRPAARQT